MATFNGYDLGLIEEDITEPNPAERQVNSYPAVNGLEVLEMGSRGAATKIRGTLSAPSLTELAAMKQDFGSSVLTAVKAELIDSEATVWPDVICTAFRPIGRRWLLGIAGEAGVAQRYEAEFLHATT